MQAHDNKIEVKGNVVETLRGDLFRVELEDEHEVMAYLAGKLRRNHIRVSLGDKVNVELSPYDLTRGRIVWRHRN